MTHEEAKAKAEEWRNAYLDLTFEIQSSANSETITRLEQKLTTIDQDLFGDGWCLQSLLKDEKD